MQNHLIVAGNGTHSLGQKLADHLKMPATCITPDFFPNEELRIRISETADAAILLGSFSRPVNSRIIEYVLAADALKRQGVKKIIGIIGWFGYSKQDKVFSPGEPLSAKVIATILQSAPISELITLDLHNPSISGYFDIPVTNASAISLLAKQAKVDDQETSIVISPDVGSIKNAAKFAELLNLQVGFATKKRNLESGEVTFHHLSHDVSNQHVYIYDDVIATGDTIIKLADFLKEKKAASINVFCTHHLYLDQAQSRIDQSAIDHLTVTNSVEVEAGNESSKLDVIDCSEVYSEVITRKHLI
jgi:ribose-phosphate pyrophosphokinase